MVHVRGCVEVAATHPGDVLDKFATTAAAPFTEMDADLAARAEAGTCTTTFVPTSVALVATPENAACGCIACTGSGFCTPPFAAHADKTSADSAALTKYFILLQSL
jgi:hypothetical protein